MSKLSFRARALDASKPMPVYNAEELPDLPDFAAINRAVPQMPTGMEKEEESEHHLQRALSAQQVYGTAERLVIPVPEIETNETDYESLYKSDFKMPKQYIHIQAFGMDQEIPDYDMDSDDEQWLKLQVKKMEITPIQFEEMMDRLEKGSGQQVVTLQEAKLLLKEDDDLIIAVYDYWLNKRLKTQHTLIPQVKTEKRDGSTTNNPYVAFRRRTEKMQTRKNRKNDEASYEKMLKLRRDLSKAVTILEMIKRREKAKKELLKLTIEIVEKRYQCGDFNGQQLAEANAQRLKYPSFLPMQSNLWNNREEIGFVRKKREYKKRKHKQANQQAQQNRESQLPQYNSEVDILQADLYTSEEEALSPALSPSDHEDENDPDGPYAFKRKRNCCYLAPINDYLGNWPWCSREEGGFADQKYRYSLASLTSPRRCVGFTRRRVGRGGRILIDRAFSQWDDELQELDIDLSSSTSGLTELDKYAKHVKENNILHFRPRTPTEDIILQQLDASPMTTVPVATTEFNFESFQIHQEQLIQMQRQQQEEILRQETSVLDSSINLEHSFSSQPTSRFTLDSATAHFAASAVVNTIPIGANAVVAGITPNGPVSTDSKSGGLSTSPAATVLQLNYPLNSKTTGTTETATTTTVSISDNNNSTTTASSPINITSSLNSNTPPVSVLATKAVTPAGPPTILKLANTATVNEHIKQNHVQEVLDNQQTPLVNKKDNIVPMEVT